MTENLLKKLEEKIMSFVTEIEELREKVERLSQENTLLKIDRENYDKKMEARIKELIMLFDTVTVVEPPRQTGTENTIDSLHLKPMLVQS